MSNVKLDFLSHPLQWILEAPISQSVMKSMTQVKALRNNIELFQKIGQLFHSSLQLLMLKNPASFSHLSSFSRALSTVNLHDFYRFFQKPFQHLYPVQPSIINEKVVSEKLAEILLGKLKLQAPELDAKELSEQFSKNFLEEKLEEMQAKGYAYCSFDEFVNALQNKLQLRKIGNVDLQGINLDDLKTSAQGINGIKWSCHVPLAEKITNWIWELTDVGGVLLYLREWNLINTAKLANSIGQYPAFQWVKNQALDHWVLGAASVGLAWQLFEAVRKLCDEKLTKQERKELTWKAVASLGELILCQTIFLNQIGKVIVSPVFIHGLSIIVKSLGVMEILQRGTIKFFERSIAAV